MGHGIWDGADEGFDTVNQLSEIYLGVGRSVQASKCSTTYSRCVVVVATLEIVGLIIVIVGLLFSWWVSDAVGLGGRGLILHTSLRRSVHVSSPTSDSDSEYHH